MAIKILLGGSPCTHWSISQSNDKREVVPSGLGWDLFYNYVLAKEKFKPDFFVYENNESISKDIQNAIEKELNVSLLHINSANFSAQKRNRIYGTNITGVHGIEDLKLCVADILDYSYKNENLIDEVRFNDNKYTSVYSNSPTRIGTIGKGGQGERVYSIHGKSVNLNANGGGRGAKTGLYLIDGIVRKLSCKEAERLQTLPDDYTKVEGVSDTQRYKCVGNGWTADVICHILKQTNISLDEEIIVLSLYDGIATGRYCLDKLGYKNVKYYAYEIDKHAIKVALHNYPDIKECGDAFELLNEGWALNYEK